MKYNPPHNRVVLRPLLQDEVTKGGVVLPQESIKLLAEGVVLEVGPGRLLDNGTVIPVWVKVGQRVVYTKYSGSNVKVLDQELLVIDDRDILLAPDLEPV